MLKPRRFVFPGQLPWSGQSDRPLRSVVAALPKKPKKIPSRRLHASTTRTRYDCPRDACPADNNEENTTWCFLDKGKPVARRGRKAMGSFPLRGGAVKAARLPKGWTGPVSMSGGPRRRKPPGFLFAHKQPFLAGAGTRADLLIAIPSGGGSLGRISQFPDSSSLRAAAAGQDCGGRIGTASAAIVEGAPCSPQQGQRLSSQTSHRPRGLGSPDELPLRAADGAR